MDLLLAVKLSTIMVLKVRDGGGIRRYQNPGGSLTPAGRKRLEKADIKWVKKKADKITAQAKSVSERT